MLSFFFFFFLNLLSSQKDCIPSLGINQKMNALSNRTFTLRGEKKACRHYRNKSGTAKLCGWCINSSGSFPFSLPLSGANLGGRESTVTGACPSPAACTAHARKHGSVSAARAGWAASVTKVSLIKASPRHPHLYLPPNTSCQIRGQGESQSLGDTRINTT